MIRVAEARPPHSRPRGAPAEPVWIARSTPDFPAQLADDRPPRGLWCLGDASLLQQRPMVAIVGTRHPTAYGERVARGLARAVAQAGGCVVSGMARGADSAAHLGALECGGATIAVLGTGVDVPYPPRNRALHRQLAETALVVSEMAPGTRAFPGCFPRRNRIIAGLAQVVVVVEGNLDSGALQTAGLAVDLGRTVAGVPGQIDSPQSAGANRLIRDGAHVITTVDDLLALAGLHAAAAPSFRTSNPDERAVYAALDGGSLSADALAVRTALPADRCVAAITALELAGAVECSLTGAIRRR